MGINDQRAGTSAGLGVVSQRMHTLLWKSSYRRHQFNGAFNKALAVHLGISWNMSIASLDLPCRPQQLTKQVTCSSCRFSDSLLQASWLCALLCLSHC